MISDLTFIPFYFGWADGLKQLLKLLEESSAPREFQNGQSAAANWFEAKQFIIRKQERLWMNLAEIKNLPKDIYRYEAAVSIPDNERSELLKQWPHISEEQVFWAFNQPPKEFDDKFKFTKRGRRENWNSTRVNDPALRHLAVRLINESLRAFALSRGLKITPDGKACYFPNELIPNNRLTFESYDRKRTWLSCVGVRTFHTGTTKESCRYHLVPHLKVWLDHELGCVILVRVHLFLTNLDGQQIEGKAALRRRKRICRSWWNHHWLARTFGILQFLAGDENSIEIGTGGSQQLVVSKYPLTAHIPFGLDESQIGLDKPESEDAEELVLDLNDDAPEMKESEPDE